MFLQRTVTVISNLCYMWIVCIIIYSYLSHSLTVTVTRFCSTHFIIVI